MRLVLLTPLPLLALAFCGGFFGFFFSVAFFLEAARCFAAISCGVFLAFAFLVDAFFAVAFFLVDAFFAMIRNRPWRPRRTLAAVADEIRAHSGTQFDPRVVASFEAALREEGLLATETDAPPGPAGGRGMGGPGRQDPVESGEKHD